MATERKRECAGESETIFKIESVSDIESEKYRTESERDHERMGVPDSKRRGARACARESTWSSM